LKAAAALVAKADAAHVAVAGDGNGGAAPKTRKKKRSAAEITAEKNEREAKRQKKAVEKEQLLANARALLRANGAPNT